MNTDGASRERFIALLRVDILQSGSSELDFGLYRVLNHRRAEIDRFLDHGLPTKIATELARLPGLATEDEQARIYNALYTFFARYYDEGDFMPRARRGRDGAYSVAYDGSDTFFHWATKGSHYVKSGERFASYAYTQADGARVRLAVVAADVERDNAKGAQRYYLPQRVERVGPIADVAGAPGALVEWQVGFAHRALVEEEVRRFVAAKASRRVGGEAVQLPEPEADAGDAAEGKDVQERILNAWFAGWVDASSSGRAPFSDAGLPREIEAEALKRHASRYVKGRSADFFVHPGLGEFLLGELDYFLKNEFLQLWDLPAEALGRERGKLAICRELARALIDVLHALEDLQARLFEKRKFVMQASYLVQCSRLRASGSEGEALVARACAHAPQVAQWKQWVGDASADHGSALLARYPHLPLDTAQFDAAFQWAVLACVPDLDAAIGGVLVHGDNYAALRTLEPSYRQAVKCIYIDPPYNTGGDGFLYKDDFTRHASWLAMMQGRLQSGRQWLADSGVQFTSIDEHEHRRLLALADDVFGADNFITNVIWQKNFSPKNTAQHFSEDHDYLTVHAKSAALWRPGLLERTEEQDAAYSNVDNDFRGVWTSGDLSARNFYSEGLYPITAPSGRVIPGPPPGTFWRVSADRFAEMDADNRVWWGSDGNNIPRQKRFLSDVMQGRVPQTLWTYREVGHTQDGKRALLALMSLATGDPVFNTLKPLKLVERCAQIGNAGWVLDYFAGSGTTGHAVINLNRDDGGQRRFVLVEQGEYFDTVTLPRIAKVMTAPEWKDGQPKATVQHEPAPGDDPAVHWSRRSPALVQVLRLERYEDSLDALALPRHIGGSMAGQAELAGVDVILRYLADATSTDNPVRLSTAMLARPFDYRLPTVWEGRYSERAVDLFHTALALLGLHPVRVRRVERNASEGPLPIGATAATAAMATKASVPVLLAEVRPHRPALAAGAVPLELLGLREFDIEALAPAEQLDACVAEYHWLVQAVQQHFGCDLSAYMLIRHNRDLMLLGEETGESIDTPLARAMWARDPHMARA